MVPSFDSFEKFVREYPPTSIGPTHTPKQKLKNGFFLFGSLEIDSTLV